MHPLQKFVFLDPTHTKQTLEILNQVALHNYAGARSFSFLSLLLLFVLGTLNGCTDIYLSYFMICFFNVNFGSF